MQSIGFQKAVEKIIEKDRRYHAEAYVFLREALDATLKRRKKAKKEPQAHVSAAELLEGFRLYGLRECGPMAITVFDYWGVRSCEDVGSMVFNLVGAGVFGKTEDDTLEGFRAAYDFEEAFVKPFQPEKNNLSESGASVVGGEA